MFLKKPFILGNLTLPSNIFCAPLCGCTDKAFREMFLLPVISRPGLMYCEMVKMDALIYGNPQTEQLLDYIPEMHPIGAQICGSNPKMAAECARKIEERGFKVLDFNCGCPVDKVTKDGSGSGMLKSLDLISEILRLMVAAVSIPVTIKIRAGWDVDSIVGPEITKRAEEAGAAAICIHGRTREQAYKGPANWDYIRDCKKVAKNIKVIGNGDIFDSISAQNIFEYTQCDAILVARGTMGQPWIFEDIERHLSNQPPIERTAIDLRNAFLTHLEYIVKYRGEERAVPFIRKIACWFLRKIKGARKLRDAINHAQSAYDIKKMVQNYPWEDCALEQDTTTSSS